MKRKFQQFIILQLVTCLLAGPVNSKTTCEQNQEKFIKSLTKFQTLLKSIDQPDQRRKVASQRQLIKPVRKKSFQAREKRFLNHQSVQAQHLISSIKVMEFINLARNGHIKNEHSRVEDFRKEIKKEKNKISKLNMGETGKIYIQSLEQLIECLNEPEKVEECSKQKINNEQVDQLKKKIAHIQKSYAEKVAKRGGGQTQKNYSLDFNQEIRYHWLKTLTEYHEILNTDNCKSPVSQKDMNTYLSFSHCGLTQKSQYGFKGQSKQISDFISNTHQVIEALIKSQANTTVAATSTAKSDQPSTGEGSHTSFDLNGPSDEEKAAMREQRLAEEAENLVDQTMKPYEKTEVPKRKATSGAGLGSMVAMLPYLMNMWQGNQQYNPYQYMQSMMPNYNGPHGMINYNQNSIPLFDPFAMHMNMYPSSYLFHETRYLGYYDFWNV